MLGIQITLLLLQIISGQEISENEVVKFKLFSNTILGDNADFLIAVNYQDIASTFNKASITANNYLLNSKKVREKVINESISANLEDLIILEQSVEIKKKEFDRASEYFFNSRKRSKRGLVDALGKLSKTLFGTALDEDVKKNANHLNILHNSFENQRRQLNIHTEILNATGKQMVQLRYIQRQLSVGIEELYNNYIELKNFDHVSALALKIESILDDLIITAINFRSAILHSFMGVWDTFFVKKEIIFEKLFSLAHRNITFPFKPINENLFAFQQMITVKLIASGNFELKFLFSIPTLANENEGIAYSYLSIPIYNKNKELCSMWIFKPIVVTVNTNGDIYKINLKKCVHLNKKTFCTPMEKCNSVNKCVCGEMLCERVVKDKCKLIASKVDSNTIFFSTPNETTGIFKCSTKYYTKTLHGSGNIRVNESCTVIINDMKWELGATELNTTININKIYFNISEMMTNKDKFASHIVNNINNTNNLQFLTEQLEILEETQWSEKNDFIFYSVITLLSLSGIIAIIIILNFPRYIVKFITTYTRTTKLERKTKNTQNPDNEDTN